MPLPSPKIYWDHTWLSWDERSLNAYWHCTIHKPKHVWTGLSTLRLPAFMTVQYEEGLRYFRALYPNLKEMFQDVFLGPLFAPCLPLKQ